MTKRLRLAIAQIDCTVGDLEGNHRKICAFLDRAKTWGVDIISFPELSITGYPPEDLLLKNKFIDDNVEMLKRTAKYVDDAVAVIGFADSFDGELYNAAAVINKGEIAGTYHKMFLPNYGVFDEKRYFKPGKTSNLFQFGQLVFGVNICEDMWHMDGPVKAQASGGAQLIININSSPYYAGRNKEREEIIRRQAKSNNVFISYTNLVGGQDELVFDGQSMVVDNAGRLIARAESFKEDLVIVDLDIAADKRGPAKTVVMVSGEPGERKKLQLPKKETKPLEPIAEIYEALLLGLRDYVAKNGFEKVVIGMSGGVDSSLVAALAADALGRQNVTGVFMSTRYSSSRSESDAKDVASALGIKLISVSIEQIFKLYLMILEAKFSGLGRDATEENLQARIRGNVLMALSNKFGWLVLTTGNKSEMSTGYATLYGDMAGGFAVIKDVPKTLVYKLCRYKNSTGAVMPDSVINKEPTAELRPNQKDSDTLPPYDKLDQILKAYIEEDKGISEIIAMGFEKETVVRVVNMVDKSEYKRRQSPPGIKITPKAFGRDRRMPITNKWGG